MNTPRNTKPHSDKQTAEFLLKMCDNVKKVEPMTNDELADALCNEIWADIDMSSRESALLSEAMRRIRDLTTGGSANE